MKPLAYMFTGTSICRWLFACKQNVTLDLFQPLRVTELFYPMSYKMSLAAFKLGNLSVSIFFLLCSSSFDMVANLENLMVHLATILKL